MTSPTTSSRRTLGRRALIGALIGAFVGVGVQAAMALACVTVSIEGGTPGRSADGLLVMYEMDTLRDVLVSYQIPASPGTFSALPNRFAAHWKQVRPVEARDPLPVAIFTGWPCRAVCGALMVEYPQSGGCVVIATRTVVRTTSGGVPPDHLVLWRTHLIPYGVMWGPFLLNVGVFTLAGTALVATPAWLRRRWRMRKGLCRTCGYQLSESQPCCPECGGAGVSLQSLGGRS